VAISRRLNLVFVAVLLTIVALLAGGMHLVHRFQVRRNASSLLDRARQAEADNDLNKTEQLLRQYLNFRPADGPAWTRYARVVDRQNLDSQRRQRVFLVHEEAFRRNPDDPILERRCADLALEVGRYNEAQFHLKNLLDKGQVPDADRAELEDLLGQSERGATRYLGAERWFLRALEHDPRRIACYDRLARLRRNDLRRYETADAAIEAMVTMNRTAGLAYVYRWRYSQQFSPPADASDIQNALRLAPEDPEVLLTAAIASEQKSDEASARVFYEKGCKRDPKNVALVLGLARLETRERHLDRAELVLRQGFDVNPAVALVVALAETLIFQEKIDAKGGAREWMARLGDAGLSDTFVRFLEAEILVQRKKWAEAMPRIEMAKVILAADPELTLRLDLMMAECARGLGDEELRLDALRAAAERAKGPGSARIELVEALARSGKLDEAVMILVPMAERNPEWRLDLVRLLLQRSIRQPRDQRNWQEVERSLTEAQTALPDSHESLALLRVDLLTAQNRLADAGSLLASLRTKEPRNLRYRLAQARLTQQRGQGPAALQILDLAERDLGPSPDLQLARLDYWSVDGGDAAKAAVAKMAEARPQILAADRPAFLDRLAAAEIRLGQLNPARQHWRELAALQPENLSVRLGLIDLAIASEDHDEAARLIDEIRQAEGEGGGRWRFAQATLIVDKVRRGASGNLDEARNLASRISERRPRWANGFALHGEIAELAGSPEQAIEYYLRAVELGEVQPSLIRRLVALLNERNRYDDIDHVAQVVRGRGAALNEITIARALDAIRKRDFDRGIKLARQVFAESSASSADHLSLGRIYMAAERSSEADKEFRRAVELGPGVPEAWLAYVQYLMQAERSDEAKAAIEAARKALPADRANVTLAQCWLSAGDASQAERLIERALSDEGESAGPVTLRVAATAALNRNRLDKVAEYLNKLDRLAAATSGDKDWVRRTRSLLLLRSGRPGDRDQALGLVQQNLRNNPTSIEDQGLKAAIFAQRPDGRGEAIKILEQAALADRLGAKEQFMLAQLYLNQHNEQKYKDEMLKLLNLKVRSPQHVAHFTNYWISRNEPDQADRWLIELRRIDPDGVVTLQLEARLLDLTKRKSELLALLEARGRQIPDQIGQVADLMNRYGFAAQAEGAYKAFIAQDTRQPERVLALAQFLAGQDRVTEAMDILKNAWEKCRPEQVVAASLLLYDAPSAKEPEKRQIEEWLADAVAKRPELISLALKLGVIRVRQGRFDEAERLFRQGLAADADNPDALNGLAWLLALKDASKTQEALRLIDRAIEVQGPTSSLLDTRAVVLIRAQQPARAVQDLREVQRLDPRKPSSALHLAWAYQTLGRVAEARSSFLKAGELGWRVANSDPLERGFVEKLQRDLSAAGN
jgi:tetratricopeptide (TPR) repeat protein